MTFQRSFSGPKKTKKTFRNLLGSTGIGRVTSDQEAEVNEIKFDEQVLHNKKMLYAHLGVKKEWAFVAMSPDTKTAVCVSDKNIFMSFSRSDSGLTKLVDNGSFEGEPTAISVSYMHLAILTLNKVLILMELYLLVLTI